MVGVRGIHGGSVILASGNLDDPSDVRNIVEQMERGNLKIQTVHPLPDLPWRVFRPDKNDPVQRDLRPGVQIRQKIDAAYKFHQRSAAGQLVNGVQFEVIRVNVCQKNQTDLLRVWFQPVPGNTAVKQEAAVQKNGIACPASGGNNITDHECSPDSPYSFLWFWERRWWTVGRPLRRQLREAGNNPHALQRLL